MPETSDVELAARMAAWLNGAAQGNDIMSDRHFANAPARTVRQVAEHWQCSERHVYDLIAQGKLGHMRIGATLIRVRQEDIAAYEAAAWHAPTPNNHASGSSQADGTPVRGSSKGPRRDAFALEQRIARQGTKT